MSIWHVNLTTGTCTAEPVADADRRQWIGGRGLAARELFRLVRPGIDPLGPENPLIFAVGPLTGTDWPAATQFHVGAKSPLSGGYGGGFGWGTFGITLRHADVDLLVITGAAATPAYLLAEPGRVEIRPADDLWGHLVGTTDAILRERHPGASVAAIGPAGEQRAAVAGIVAEATFNMIRTGLGAVMGAKRLKAVAVRGGAPPAVPAPYAACCAEMQAKVAAHPGAEHFGMWGYGNLVSSKNTVGDLPTRNHQAGHFEGAAKLASAGLQEHFVARQHCPTCPIGCLKRTEVKFGRWKSRLVGPGYEPINALGPRLGNDNLEALIYAAALCNDLGLDPVGAGATIAFAMECHQRGLLSDPAFSLEWGDMECVVALLEAMARRQGLGDLLADGPRRAAQQLGGEAWRYSMDIKGVPMSGQDPRQSKAFGLSLATSNWGGEWGYGFPTIDVAHNLKAAQALVPDLLPEVMDVSSPARKAPLVVMSEQWNAAADSAGLCKYSAPETYAVLPSDVAAGLSALWGQAISAADVMAAGERIINLERLFNLREGFGRQDDLVPERFRTEVLTVDVFTGDRATGLQKTGECRRLLFENDALLDEYYRLRSWSPTGRPTRAKLRELGLAELAADLWEGLT